MTQTDNMNAVTSITKSLLKELTVVVQASIKDKLFNNIGLTKSHSEENESYRKNAEYKLRISEFLLQVTMHRLSQQIFASLNWLHELWKLKASSEPVTTAQTDAPFIDATSIWNIIQSNSVWDWLTSMRKSQLLPNIWKLTSQWEETLELEQRASVLNDTTMTGGASTTDWDMSWIIRGDRQPFSTFKDEPKL